MVPRQGRSQAMFPENDILLVQPLRFMSFCFHNKNQLEMAHLPDQAALKSQLDALAASSAGQLPLDSGIRNGEVSSNFRFPPREC